MHKSVLGRHLWRQFHSFGTWIHRAKSTHRRFHSLNESKRTPIVRRIDKTKQKSSRLIKEQDVMPNVYMREVITRISNVLRYSTWDSAQEQLDNFGLKWDSFTINQVLKTHPPMEKAWLFFNWASSRKGFKHDHFTYTTMLDIFGEAKRISSMKYLFHQMQEKRIKIDAVTYTSVINWLSNDGDVEGAVELWKEMRARGCCPTVVSYTAYMKVLFDHNKVKEAVEVYKEMLEAGCTPNCYTYTVLMRHLASCGRFSEVMDIFNKMQEVGVYPDKAACNILVEKCCIAGEVETMLKILNYMKEHCLVLRHPVYLQALQTLHALGASDALLKQVNPHSSVENFGKLYYDNFDYASCDSICITDRGILLHMLCKQNLVSIDNFLVDWLDRSAKLDPGVVSMIIEMNCSCSRQSGALLAFEYSVNTGIDVDKITYLALLGLCLRSHLYPKVVDVIYAMIKAGISPGTHITALSIYRLGYAKDSSSAVELFNSLPVDHKSTATYTALMAAHFSSGNAEKGLETFEIMKREEVGVAVGTYNVLLFGLEKAGKGYELDIYRKAKKSLQARSFSLNISKEEKLCNHLFGGEIMF